MQPVNVIHLVWVPAGLAPLQRFLDSYQARAAGLTHDFSVIFNGHQTRDELAPYQTLLKSVAYDALILDRPTQDLVSYLHAARCFKQEYVLFFNSYSVIQEGEWLAKYMTTMQMDSTGIVGATGTWVSSLTHFLAHYYPDGGRPFHKQPLDLGRRLRKRLDFPPFPNPHVRTNAFMMRRHHLLRFAPSPPQSKDDAYRFESGRRGLTAQILRQGLTARLVGRNGLSYTPTEWAASNIYRQSHQENLLVTDNQTNIYDRADLPTRAMLCREAWGEQARPAI